MLEARIEKRLRDDVARIGGKAYKFVSPGEGGVPDRVILLPGGKMLFVETKAPGEKERPLQLYQQGVIRSLGFTVFSTVDSYARVAEVLAYCERVRRK